VNDAEENDATAMSAFFRELKRFCQEGITVILLHHERKDGVIKGRVQDRMRGSSDILAAIDSHISVRTDKRDDTVIIIEHSKSRCEKKLDPFEVHVKDGESGIEFEYLGKSVAALSKVEVAKELIIATLEEMTEGLTINQLVGNVRADEAVGDKTVRSAIKDLVKEGLIREENGLKNEKICFLVTESEQNGKTSPP
jgi:hypothetical protein